MALVKVVDCTVPTGTKYVIPSGISSPYGFDMQGVKSAWLDFPLVASYYSTATVEMRPHASSDNSTFRALYDVHAIGWGDIHDWTTTGNCYLPLPVYDGFRYLRTYIWDVTTTTVSCSYVLNYGSESLKRPQLNYVRPTLRGI